MSVIKLVSYIVVQQVSPSILLLNKNPVIGPVSQAVGGVSPASTMPPSLINGNNHAIYIS